VSSFWSERRRPSGAETAASRWQQCGSRTTTSPICRSTRGLDPEKSNWANPLERPPFEAFAVTCGITFTFGGLAVDRRARVLDEDHRPIPRLFAAGELVGGLFFDNYPGGSGPAAGAVFGRLAGSGAARSGGGE